MYTTLICGPRNTENDSLQTLFAPALPLLLFDAGDEAERVELTLVLVIAAEACGCGAESPVMVAIRDDRALLLFPPALRLRAIQTRSDQLRFLLCLFHLVSFVRSLPSSDAFDDFFGEVEEEGGNGDGTTNFPDLKQIRGIIISITIILILIFFSFFESLLLL